MTFHVQAGVPNWLEAVAKLPAGVVVKAFEVQKMAEIKAANAAVKTLHRHWNDPYQNVSPSDTDAIREQRARGWFNQFVDGTFLDGSTAGRNHALSTDFVSFWNEYYAQSQTAAEKELWWRQERVAARIWRDEYRHGPNGAKLNHIRLTICATAVGNDLPWQSAETAVLYDCVLDYHPYDKWLNGTRQLDSWQNYSGRWVAMDADFRNRGYSCLWLFGEGGPYSGPVDGWKHSTVCGGDAAKYVTAVKWWIDQCKTTAAYQQGRVLGPPTLFTTGGGSQWSSFETTQPVLNQIADVVRANWNNVPIPPDPPDPPDPEPEPGGNLLRHADFEGYETWYDGPTGQVPDEWLFEYYTGANQYDPAAYVKPETRVILKAQLPAGEWEQFGLEDNQAVKAFKGGAPWHGSYIQNLSQPLSKPGKATIRFFADLVKSYNPKVYATYDPNNPAGHLRVNGSAWYLMRPGEINAPVFDLPVGTSQLKIEWRCNYPLANNIFFDGPRLEEVDAPPPPGDPCLPRVAYSRTYVVLPQAATAEQFAEVAKQYHGQRRTIGFSYDDAGHGPGLTSRTAILLGIPDNERQLFIDWYAEHYPGTAVQFEVLPPQPFRL
jgi:hypothetical protein